MVLSGGPPLSFAARAATCILLLAGLAGCGGQEKFLAERRAEVVGYRFEYFEPERLLFIHWPNGEKDGVDLATLQRVFLFRMNASDSTTGKTTYWWEFGAPQRTVSAPFFSVEPRTVVGILKRELAGFDEVTATKMATAFEKGGSSYCLLWASEAYLKEFHAHKEQACAP